MAFLWENKQKKESVAVDKSIDSMFSDAADAYEEYIEDEDDEDCDDSHLLSVNGDDERTDTLI